MEWSKDRMRLWVQREEAIGERINRRTGDGRKEWERDDEAEKDKYRENEGMCVCGVGEGNRVGETEGGGRGREGRGMLHFSDSTD